jgi:probable F420-dependent oxidoreductase
MGPRPQRTRSVISRCKIKACGSVYGTRSALLSSNWEGIIELLRMNCMRFGVHLPHFGRFGSPENIRRIAEAAEAFGFDDVWVSDHIVGAASVVANFGPGFWEALTVLTYAAAVTKTVRLGTSMIVAPYRDPLVTAKVIASLDQLSQGRVICGVAPGGLEPEFEALGLTFAERGRQTDEYLQIYKEAWTKDRPEFHGRYRTFGGFTFEPKPVQKPHPPLWIGALTARGIRRAVEFGDGWQPVLQTSLSETKAGIDTLHRIADRRGRTLDGFTISLRLPMWFTDTKGNDEGRLLTTADDMVTRLAAYRDLGVSHVLLDHFIHVAHGPSTTIDTIMSAMERFAREVRPKLM